MERCRVCGKIETPLRDGVCPQCIATRRSAAESELAGDSPPPRGSSYASAATFLWNGTGLEIVGIFLLLMGQQALRMNPVGLLIVLAGGGLLIFGGILVSVGVIRWGILPLIERADRK